MSCSNPHPDQPRIFCGLAAANHAQCSGFDPAEPRPAWVSWPNPDYTPPRETVGGTAVRKTLSQLARKVPR